MRTLVVVTSPPECFPDCSCCSGCHLGRAGERVDEGALGKRERGEHNSEGGGCERVDAVGGGGGREWN